MTNHSIKPLFLALAAAAIATPAMAQNVEGKYRMSDATELWRLTDNAAGLSLDSREKRGFAEFDLSHRGGNLHRVQEGGQRNLLSFDTEQYQNIGKGIRAYGRFTFNMDRTKDRAWADVMRPYDANPFFTGSSVHGKYDTQLFDLTAAIATTSIAGMNVGARLDYTVGDQSRLRDPRSRNELLNYRITPSLTYTFGSHSTAGLSLHYDRRKEKLPGLTTVQEDPNLVYYTMTGMEAATGTVAGYKGFQREWVQHQFGAAASMQHNDIVKGVNSLTTLSISRATEDAWGQYKYSPGKYIHYTYGIESHNRLSGVGRTHHIDITAHLTEGYADENRQALVQERDAGTGYTSFRYDTQIEYKKRYQHRLFDAALHYRYDVVDNLAVTAYAGATLSMTGSHTKHLLHTSELDHQRMAAQIEAGYALLGGRLWIDATAAYSPSTHASISLADPSTDYAQQVLLPDMEYYRADLFAATLAAKYSFPLTIKGNTINAYVKAYAQRTKGDNSRDMRTFGLTFGTSLAGH